MAARPTRAIPADRRDLRQWWEQQWRERGDFAWSLEGAAPQLQELVAGGELPAGAALDLGCGAGEATAFLAEHFTPAVGVDIAAAAVRRAAASEGVPPTLLAADALDLPFAPRSFVLVHDRGCLQNLPRSAWRAYFSEVSRVLRPGGSLQLLVSTPDAPARKAGLRQAASRPAARIRGASALDPARGAISHEWLAEQAPPALTLERIEDFGFTLRDGCRRRFTHALFRAGI